MGCCFSKELNHGLPCERSSLLHPPLHDGLSEGTDQVRQLAVAVAQHVCLDEEETCVADAVAQRKPAEDEERHPGLDNKVCREGAAVSGDITTRSKREPKAAGTHGEKEAIIITNIHSNRDTEPGMTQTARPSCGPAPYMEVRTRSPAEHKNLDNATVRAMWFKQLPEGQRPKPAKCRSAPARFPSRSANNVTESEVSDDPPLPVGAYEERSRIHLKLSSRRRKMRRSVSLKKGPGVSTAYVPSTLTTLNMTTTHKPKQLARHTWCTQLK
ncbi:Tyrosine-protein phosphatase 1 [Dissostichus eleginoides]|uniref:Tyrosine-protein phosphatase 1 n=1 Tax=Dissostichus eleginoides TaxID=100907 RepID=A0AAD9F0I2_DISEL|nr:Tyrosine-protein phosphatase 1 [Dissostichus eleginoides]